MIISGNLQKILKILHLFAVSFWVGTCLSELILFYVSSNAESGGELFGLLRASRLISTYVTVYLGAFGSFFTGLAYSLCTQRGFVRHKWVIIKWVSTIYLMFCGFKFMEPWSTEMLETAWTIGLEALNLEAYLGLRQKILILVSVNMVLLAVLMVISVYKPWEVAESIRLLNKKLRVGK